MSVRHLMSRYYLLLSFLVGFAVIPAAKANESSSTLAMQLVELMQYSDQYKEYHSQCVTTSKSVTPESLAEKNPDRFYGIRPGSKLWPEVIKAYDVYYQQVCERPTQMEFMRTIADAYARKLSVQQLRDTIRFYSSPTGKRLIEANKAAVRSVYEEWNRLNARQIPVADENFNRRMYELSKKCVK